jgi:hypothetical protein
MMAKYCASCGESVADGRGRSTIEILPAEGVDKPQQSGTLCPPCDSDVRKFLPYLEIGEQPEQAEPDEATAD